MPADFVSQFVSLPSDEWRPSTPGTRALQQSHIADSCDIVSRSSVHSTPFETFVETLQLAGLSGPVVLSGKSRKLGEGGQFCVYQQEVYFMRDIKSNGFPVAIKRPNLPAAYTTPMDLADSSVQKNLRHIYNEIKALTDERLRYHPNIINLLSWAYDVDWSRSIVLVLELAREDLDKALKDPDPPGLYLRILFCSDLANGLEAMHKANFVHGDLKPANVLIVNGPSRPIAKLADFGYSGEQGVDATHGTPGWQAPGKEATIEADLFTYGLLIWSMLILSGRTPPESIAQSRRSLALEDLKVHQSRFPKEVYTRMRNALSSLLDEDIAMRPRRLTTFFAHTTEIVIID
jgi:serine/threonine protein kinase